MALFYMSIMLNRRGGDTMTAARQAANVALQCFLTSDISCAINCVLWCDIVVIVLIIIADQEIDNDWPIGSGGAALSARRCITKGVGPVRFFLQVYDFAAIFCAPRRHQNS